MAEEIVLPATSTGERPPIRIAFCITDLDVGGAENVFVELVTRLNRRRWQPQVFSLSVPGALVEKLQAHGIPVTCFGAKSIRDLQVIWSLAAALKEFRPALIQCFLFHANLIGRFAARWAGVPHVICGIRVAERRGRIRLWFDRITQCFVDHNVCVSGAVAEFSIQKGGLSRRKISVIPNAVDYERFASATRVDRSVFGLSEHAPLILFVGRLDPQKAPFVLLDAFSNLLMRHPEWQLMLVGEGPLRPSIERWIEEHEIARKVQLTGFRVDVPEILKTADVLVLPSLWEGMPNIVLEAMAAGLPVVATRVEGTEELIRDGESGLLVGPGSRSDLETRIETLLTDKPFAARLAKTAQEATSKLFRVETMISAYEQLYSETLKKDERSAVQNQPSKNS